MSGISKSLQRGAALSIALVAVLFVGRASAGDAYENQISMTVNLLNATPETFGKACLRLGGTLTEGEGMSKCERAKMLLAATFNGETAIIAMIAYPATPEDIQGLQKKAREVFGEPDVVAERELTWNLQNRLIASAGYDEEYSSFVMARQ